MQQRHSQVSRFSFLRLGQLDTGCHHTRLEAARDYVPQLDGLRALAVLAVCYGHVSASQMIPAWLQLKTLGPAGVTVFFVISGFVITRGLLGERIQLLPFFVRRIFRLAPAVVFFLAVTLVLAWKMVLPLSLRDLLHAATYTANYYHPVHTTLEHLWSLSVEEQFYALWPVALLCVGLSRLRTVLLAALFVCPLLRIALWLAGTDPLLIFRRFELTCDSMALGCLLAMVKVRVPNGLAGCCAAWLLVGALLNRSPVLRLATEPLTLLAAGGLVAVAPSVRLLASAPLVWIGRLSFSLYLWQQLFLLPSGVALRMPLGPALIAAFGAAAFSFYVVEAPLRKVGRRLAARLRRQPAHAPGLIDRTLVHDPVV